MQTLKIDVTEYTRQDGLKAIRLPTGMWVIRKVYGPAWFYSDSKSEWVLSNTLATLDAVGMDFDRAMGLLNTLPELS
jgi:hypothetical protein